MNNHLQIVLIALVGGISCADREIFAANWAIATSFAVPSYMVQFGLSFSLAR